MKLTSDYVIIAVFVFDILLHNESDIIHLAEFPDTYPTHNSLAHPLK